MPCSLPFCLLFCLSHIQSTAKPLGHLVVLPFLLHPLQHGLSSGRVISRFVSRDRLPAGFAAFDHVLTIWSSPHFLVDLVVHPVTFIPPTHPSTHHLSQMKLSAADEGKLLGPAHTPPCLPPHHSAGEAPPSSHTQPAGRPFIPSRTLSPGIGHLQTWFGVISFKRSLASLHMSATTLSRRCWIPTVTSRR